MRREHGVALAAALVAVVVLTAGGCWSGWVGDGELGLEWAVMPAPAVPVPAVGCTPGPAGGGAPQDPELALPGATSVDCTQVHLSETYYVGIFAVSDPGAPPALGSAAFRVAFATCAREANQFLGGDYRTARVVIRAVVPSAVQWAGGARWYRCVLIEVKTARGGVVSRTESLRDGLRGSRPLALTCANEQLTAKVLDVAFVACSTLHDYELTGVYTAPSGAFPGGAEAYDAAFTACYGIGATYLGLSKSALDRVGGVSWVPWVTWGRADVASSWAAGDRSFWCFMGEYPYRKLSGSIKGRKPGTFPH